METKNKYSTTHYQDYLSLNKLLDAQHLRSEALGIPAHEEMLFIVVHQSYELWFKQIIHELESVIDMFNKDTVDEKNIGTATSRMNRVIIIFKLLIDHIPIMESMTPLDFLDFRNYLFPASGFQSFQFRKIENLLGLKEDSRMTYGGHHYGAFFSEEQKSELEKIHNNGNLFNAVESWLERIPFLTNHKFDFLSYYKEAVERMVSNEATAIKSSEYLSDAEKEMRLKMMGNTDTFFKSILDPNVHSQYIQEGKQRLSYKATLASLMISLYNEEPLLQLPYRFLLSIIDIDELLTTWRYRHAQMVLRMLGRKTGTGGSSGHEYLSETASKHHIFKDLHNISTLLIPRSELPQLPDEIKRQLGFVYSTLK